MGGGKRIEVLQTEGAHVQRCRGRKAQDREAMLI